MPNNYRELLDCYFERRDPFAERRKLAGDFGAEYARLFLPFVRSLEAAEQRDLIRLLGDIAVGRNSRSSAWQAEALRLLQRMAYPWPEDIRFLLNEIRGILTEEFSNPENLAIWASWHPKSGVTELRRQSVYALIVLGLLLVLDPTIAESEAVQYLLRSARDERFREQIRRIPELLRGLDVASPTPDKSTWMAEHQGGH